LKDLRHIATDKLNSTQQEFLALLKLAGWSMAEASRQLNVSRATITQILNGKNTPRPATMDLLRLKTDPARVKYPEREEIVMTGGQTRTPIGQRLGEAIDRLKQIVPAPVISWARGGEGAYYEDQGSDVPKIYVPCKDPNCYVLQLEGDSMHPVYLEGDLLVVAPNLEPTNNDLVVLKTTDDEVLFKKYKHPRRDELFEFHSYNPHHPPLFLTPDKIYRVSVVHSVIRPLKERLRAMAISESAHMP
jgi:phage repressor protein C with HTH and peptisase S24 domain